MSSESTYCTVCGNLVLCVCVIKEAHKVDCRYKIAACLSIEIACEHGYQACPICDPCSCGVGGEIPVG